MRNGVLALLACLLAAQVTVPAVAETARIRVLPEAFPPAQPTRRFEAVSPDVHAVGKLQRIIAHDHDTFVDIARRFGLGFDELVAANPDVDPWLPGAGTEVLLPTLYLLPDAPREGVVLNIASMRLFRYSEPDAAGRQTIETFAVGIGRVGWATPVGEFSVIQKTENPAWYPPASVRKEHEEAGDPLPAVVPAGPDNPLGSHAIRLNLPSYLIHGTNKPAGVGMRVSHGCVRLYPEDIAALFGAVAVGASVRIVDQPYLAAVHGQRLLLEVHAPLEDGNKDWLGALDQLATLAGGDPVDWQRVAASGRELSGVPIPVGANGPTPRRWRALAEQVSNPAPLENAGPDATGG